jgi:hypothetical protein
MLDHGDAGASASIVPMDDDESGRCDHVSATDVDAARDRDDRSAP